MRSRGMVSTSSPCRRMNTPPRKRTSDLKDTKSTALRIQLGAGSRGAYECLELVARTLDRGGHGETLFEQELLDDQPARVSIELHIRRYDEAVAGQDWQDVVTTLPLRRRQV